MMGRWTRIMLAALVAVALAGGNAGADERTLVKAVEKLILDQQRLDRENQALKERVHGLELKVKGLEVRIDQLKESRTSAAPTGSRENGEPGLLSKIKRFFVGGPASQEQKESAGAVEVVKPAPVVDPMKLLQQEKPKDCTSAEGVEPLDSTTGGCSG